MTADEVADGLEHQSGMAGLSGTSGDVRDVLAAADAGDERSRLAFAVLVHRLRQAIAAMASSLGGLDVLAFTGGVGGHSTRLRHDVCVGLRFLGVELDDARNASTKVDGDITASGTRVRTVVVTSREDLEIASQVRTVTG